MNLHEYPGGPSLLCKGLKQRVSRLDFQEAVGPVDLQKVLSVFCIQDGQQSVLCFYLDAVVGSGGLLKKYN